MKAMIMVGIVIGGLIGGAIGAMFDHGNMMGGWSIILGGVGSLAGIWGAVQANKYF
jgi:hypothetical protein